MTTQKWWQAEQYGSTNTWFLSLGDDKVSHTCGSEIPIKRLAQLLNKQQADHATMFEDRRNARIDHGLACVQRDSALQRVSKMERKLKRAKEKMIEMQKCIERHKKQQAIDHAFKEACKEMLRNMGADIPTYRIQ